MHLKEVEWAREYAILVALNGNDISLLSDLKFVEYQIMFIWALSSDNGQDLEEEMSRLTEGAGARLLVTQFWCCELQNIFLFLSHLSFMYQPNHLNLHFQLKLIAMTPAYFCHLSNPTI